MSRILPPGTMPEPANRPLRVFLCHSSADKPAALRLYHYLTEKGMDPWLDVEKLMPGQRWQVEIPKALYASDAILVILSKSSITKEGYVQREIKFALDKALEMPEDRIFLIPARLEECDIPESLISYQWVDLFERNWSRRLMRSLNERAVQLGLIARPNAELETTQPPMPFDKPGTRDDNILRRLPAKMDNDAKETYVKHADSNRGGKRPRSGNPVRTLLFIAGLLILSLCVATVIFLSANLPLAIVSTATPTIPTATPTVTLTATPTATPDPNMVQPGTYVVGTEIKAGLYTGDANASVSCYWVRYRDSGTGLSSMIINGSPDGRFYIEVKETDYAFRTDCQLMRLAGLPAHSGEYFQVLPPGTYLVGTEIRPGLYRIAAGSNVGELCYYERLKGFSGEITDIIANGDVKETSSVEVLPSDLALTTKCELEWVSD